MSEIGTLQDIGLGGIAVLPDRMRVLRPNIIDVIARSFKEIGQKQPIVVRPNPGRGFYLVAGRHRLEAARKLKWPAIAAIVIEGESVNRALIAEIDENLARGELSAVERAEHLSRRKEAYETEFPGRKHGGDRRQGASRKLCDLGGRYTKEEAGATGRSERAVQLDTTRGKRLRLTTDKPLSLVDTSLDKGAELDALGELAKDDGERAKDLVVRAVKGEKVSAKAELKKVKRQKKERELGCKQIALPSKQYGVVLADPEWRFEPFSRDTGLDRAADNHYPTSALDEIKARPVQTIAAPDSVLFLWATVPMLPQALEVMKAWGFDYRSHAVWTKDKAGTGYWFRCSHELLLVGVKGNIPAPAPGTQWNSAVDAPAGVHSAKPELFLQLIENYFPTLPKIELNRRGPARPGWDAWGNESEAAAAIAA